MPGTYPADSPGGAASTAATKPSGFSTAMLDDLLNNPPDPGYRLAFQAQQARTEDSAEDSGQGRAGLAARRWGDGPVLWGARVPGGARAGRPARVGRAGAVAGLLRGGPAAGGGLPAAAPVGTGPRGRPQGP